MPWALDRLSVLKRWMQEIVAVGVFVVFEKVLTTAAKFI